MNPTTTPAIDSTWYYYWEHAFSIWPSLGCCKYMASSPCLPASSSNNLKSQLTCDAFTIAREAAACGFYVMQSVGYMHASAIEHEHNVCNIWTDLSQASCMHYKSRWWCVHLHLRKEKQHLAVFATWTLTNSPPITTANTSLVSKKKQRYIV